MPVDRTAELHAAAQAHAQRAGRDPVRFPFPAALRRGSQRSRGRRVSRVPILIVINSFS